MMRVVLLGPPGSGKGTQGRLISQEFNIPHISVGELLREGEHYREYRHIMDKGELVPDYIVDMAVANRINWHDCKKGFVLDGYPRTLDQAKKLGRIDAAIELHLPGTTSRARMMGRGRENEDKDVIEKRLLVHRDHGLDVADYYRDKADSMITVWADDTPENIYNKIRLFLEISKV